MGKAWFWTKRVGRERTAHLESLAELHGEMTVVQEREQGVFGNTYPVAHGVHRGRNVVVRFGTNGYRQSREASETHTVIEVPAIGGLPTGLRVFPAMGGGLKAKGGANGHAQAWLTGGERYGALTHWLTTIGFVTVSDRQGLRVHLDGVDLPPERIVAWLDAVLDLVETLEVSATV